MVTLASSSRRGASSVCKNVARSLASASALRAASRALRVSSDAFAAAVSRFAAAASCAADACASALAASRDCAMTSRSRAASSASPSAFSIRPADSAFAAATATSTSPMQSRMVRIKALARWEKSFATAICALKSYLVSFVASFMAMSSSYSGSNSIGDDASPLLKPFAAFGFLAAGGALVVTVGAMGLRLVPVAALFAGAFSLPLPRDWLDTGGRGAG